MQLLLFNIIKFESVGGQKAGPCATIPGLIGILELSGRVLGQLEAAQLPAGWTAFQRAGGRLTIKISVG